MGVVPRLRRSAVVAVAAIILSVLGSGASALIGPIPLGPGRQLTLPQRLLTAQAAASSWNLASDFRLSPNQQNPQPDSLGNPGVWSFLGASGQTHDPATYSLLPTFVSNAFGINGLQQWAASPGPNTLPAVGVNATGSTQTPLTITWPAGVTRVHPGPSNLVVVRWQSPISGSVAIAGQAKSLDGNGGDGIAWSIDLANASGYTTIDSGSYGVGGSQTFASGVGGGSIGNVAISGGDSLYFVVDPKSTYFNDSTELDITITANAGSFAGPTTAELYGARNLAEACTCVNETRTPVNTATGNFWHTFNDLSIPGRGVPLQVSRTYSSLAAGTNGPLGYGWTHAYNLTLSTDSGGNVTATQENGSTVPISRNATGGYTPPSRVIATLVKNVDGTLTFTRTDQVRWTFAASGVLQKAVDLNGFATTFAYSGTQLATVTDSAGRTLSFSSDASGRITRVSDPAGRSVAFSYDGNGNLATATDVAGGLTRFTYDANHRLLTMTDPRGGVVTNTYDASGRVTAQSDPFNRVTSFSYGAGVTTMTDPNGHQTVERYQGNVLISLTRGAGTPQAATWTYTRDPATLAIATATDPNGRVTTNTWDPSGNLLSSTDALGRTRSFTYNAMSEVTSGTDAVGVRTTSTYDANGNLLSVSRPLVGTGQTATRTLTYSDAAHPGDVTALTDPDGKTWSYAYDASGNRVRSQDPLGDATTFQYDAAGRMTAKVSPRGNVPGGNPAAFTTNFSVSAFGDRTAVADPLGNATRYQYDSNRNLTGVTDADTHTTTYTYDLANQLTKVTRADGSTLSNAYDGAGNLTGQTDGLQRTTTYTFDPLDRLVAMTDPLNRKAAFGYDGAGNRTALTDAGSRTTTYGYDAANQLTTIAYSDGSTPNISFTYDANGRRKTLADGRGTTTYTYDSLYRLTQTVNGGGQTVGYGYDLRGNLTSLTYPTGVIVRRTYDDASRLSAVSDWLNNRTTFAYDPDSNLVTQAYANGVQASAIFDNADRLTGLSHSLAGTAFLTFGYPRDGKGLLTAANPNGAAGTSETYGYDAVDRVSSVVAPNSPAIPQGYSYDAADQLTQVTYSGATSSLSYDTASELLTLTVTPSGQPARQLRFSYDANGNRTQVADLVTGISTAYGYDQANRLTAFAGQAQYAYNGDGLRVRKTASGQATAFTWDLAEGLPLLMQEGNTQYVTGPGGLPLEEVLPSGAVYFYHADQLGSTRALTDAAGAVAATYSYDPYGNLVATSGSVANPLQYAGQYRDAESGLYYLRARYYDPATSQFISRDPAVATTREPYSYVGANPLNSTDPSGLYNCGLAVWNCITNPFTSWPQAQQNFVNNFQNGGYIAVGIPLVVAGGIAVAGLALAATPAVVPTVAGMPIIPSALQKLSDFAAKFGTDEETLASNVLQNGSRYIDTANRGNINCLLQRPDAASGFVRITLDPNSQRIISAGMMKANSLVNGLASGRFIPQ